MAWRRRLALCFVALSLLSAGPSYAAGPRPDEPHDGGEAPQQRDDPAGRARWFLRGRLAPAGQSSALLRLRAHQARQAMEKKQLEEARAASSAIPAQTSFSAAGGGNQFTSLTTWQPLGPAPLVSDPTFTTQDYGNVTGRVTAIAVDQGDPTGNTVYVGGAYGGVWKSTNAAAANPANVVFTPLTDNQPTLATGAIAIDPVNSNTVLVGTGEPDSAIDSYYGLGILRSTDAGATWNVISSADGGLHSLLGLGFSKIAWKSDGSVVVAATAGTIGQNMGLLNITKGIYFSLDQGATWSLATMSDPGGAPNPGSVSDVVWNQGAGKFFAAVRFHGFYSSSDGQSWTRLGAQPSAILSTTACPPGTSTSCPMFRGELAVVPGRNEMYAWFIENNAITNALIDRGIFKSTNGGASWSSMNVTGIDTCGDGTGASSGCGVFQGFFDLYLSAIPNGGGTDVYAGAVNVYKSINGGAFLNTTHVYGCWQIARMHPDYHAQDFSAGSPNVIYFGNDGGLYRTLNGPGITLGSCGGGTNPIQNLNASLGSFTQYVNFSQHPSNSQIILGGTQDNGSPGTSSAGSSATWQTVNFGDGGFDAIDAVNPNNVYTSNTDVSTFYCAASSGDPTCVFLFYNPAIQAGTNIPDHGTFYVPWLLDPANQSQAIVGTCRIWRGNADGSGAWAANSYANALSNKFTDGLGNGNACQNNAEPFYVHAVAAGGPTANGMSQVIYAGNEGNGAGSGGTIFVTTNAAGGAGTWVDRTNGINPSGYNVGSITIDTTDATGQTAYATIMGFGTGHVFKTTNAGQSWQNLTTNLPDVPADSLAIDPNNHNILYLGTDVGVFISSNGGASWNVYGSGLPSVPITALKIFNSGGVQLLRASTYGRGIWQVSISAPDFSFTISNPTLMIFAGQSSKFTGTLTAQSNFASQVTITCGSGAPANCLPPSPLVPSSGGSPVAVNVGPSPTGAYSFNLNASSTNPSLTHSVAVTLNSVTWNMTAINPNSATVLAGNGVAVNFTVSVQGPFNQTVSLACNGLPAGASCSFLPSATIAPTAGQPANVTATVITSTSTPASTQTVTIDATTAGAPAPLSRSFTLNVSSYALAVSPTTIYALPHTAPVFAGSLTGSNGYNAPVIVSCAPGVSAPPPTCTGGNFPSDGSLQSLVTFTDVGAVGDYDFFINAAGTDANNIPQQQRVVLHVVDFALATPAPATVNMVNGSTSQPINFKLTPMGSFTGAVALACNAPPGITCIFSPPGPGLSNAAVPIVLVVSTDQTVAPGAYALDITGSALGGVRLAPTQLTVNVAGGGPATNLAVTSLTTSADPNPIGGPLTLQVTVTNTGADANNAILYFSFSTPASALMLDPGCASTLDPATSLTTVSCTLGSAGTMLDGEVDVRTIAIAPSFGRSLMASALVSSDASEALTSDNASSAQVQIRPRPFARAGIGVILP